MYVVVGRSTLQYDLALVYMERDLLTLYKDLRSQYADKPDLNDLAVELCTDMRSTLDSRHRYLVLLGHWTEQLQAILMD